MTQRKQQTTITTTKVDNINRLVINNVNYYTPEVKENELYNAEMVVERSEVKGLGEFSQPRPYAWHCTA